VTAGTHPDAPPRLSRLQITVRHDDERCLVRLRGELDVYTAHTLATRLDRSHLPDLPFVIDVDGLRVLDSAGAAAIDAVRRRATRSGTTAGIRANDPGMRSVLRLCGLGDLIGDPEARRRPRSRR
jgi:anti-anti-sigma factor